MTFETYVEQVLAPTLRPGDIVVMDNLRCHKGAAIERAIQAVGAERRDLPAYSPDLNPIEKLFSKLKAGLRAMAARTVERLYEALGEALRTVTEQDIAGWFGSCGYFHALGSKNPRLPGENFSTSQGASSFGKRCSEDADAIRLGDREARGGRALCSALQSGFQPTCEPTGFQPVERQFYINVQVVGSKIPRLPGENFQYATWAGRPDDRPHLVRIYLDAS
jgi:transposase